MHSQMPRTGDPHPSAGTSPLTVHVEDGTTFPFPIAENPADITAELTRMMESVLDGDSLDSFDGLNRRVNELFEE
jgi:multiple sugar transport system substrate-binding protein